MNASSNRPQRPQRIAESDTNDKEGDVFTYADGNERDHSTPNQGYGAGTYAKSKEA